MVIMVGILDVAFPIISLVVFSLLTLQFSRLSARVNTKPF